MDGCGLLFIRPTIDQLMSTSSDRTARRCLFSIVREGPVELRENYGLSGRELAIAERVANGHIKDLCRAWEGIHGIG